MKKILLSFFTLSTFLFASEGNAPHLDGSELSIFWVIPFVGILLSIAIFPLIAPHFWHHNFGKISAFWAVLFVAPFLISAGFSITFYEILHVGFLEYIPFIILLLALFTISGGVQLTGSLVGTPIMNTGIIFVGTVLASWMGTTGAAMLLIRPLLRANKDRKHKVHVVVFFIFLVANIGGSLTPLGDPPLFLGFLKGVDFFWTTKAMFLPMLFLVASLLIIFYIYDNIQYKKEEKIPIPIDKEKIGLKGSFNLLLSAYGLEVIHFVPASTEKVITTPLEIQRPHKSAVWKYAAAAAIALPIAFYSIWIPVKTPAIQSGMFSYQDFNPFKTQGASSYVEATVNLPHIEDVSIESTYTDAYDAHTNPVVLTNDQSTFTVKAHTMYCIAGCFSSEQNANRLSQKLDLLGFDCKILHEGGLYKVSLGQGISDQAINNIHLKAKSLNIDTWILK